MKKPKIVLPPVRVSATSMQEMINKGGSVLAEPIAAASEPEEDKLKSFTFKIYESELAQIREIQHALPKRDRISIHDFVLAAVKARIEQERNTTT